MNGGWEICRLRKEEIRWEQKENKLLVVSLADEFSLTFTRDLKPVSLKLRRHAIWSAQSAVTPAQ